MAVFVSRRFLQQILMKRFCQIDTRLVGEADEHKQNVCDFVAEVSIFVRFFEALFPVLARHQSCQFTNFLHQDGHVGQFRVVSNANFLDPGVDFRLCFLESQIIHVYSLYLMLPILQVAPFVPSHNRWIKIDISGIEPGGWKIDWEALGPWILMKLKMIGIWQSGFFLLDELGLAVKNAPIQRIQLFIYSLRFVSVSLGILDRSQSVWKKSYLDIH